MRNDLAVAVEGLVKSYGPRRVVDRLDLEVATGEVVGLIGANGAGKTTAVECIQGLRRPDAGRLRVFGLDPVTEAPRLRGLVGSQLQSAGLPDRLRVGEAVKLFGGSAGQDLLELFGLTPRRHSPYATLSGGERQRLFLVLALVNQPRLVILDELTEGLDPTARRTVWAAIDRLRDDGTTVVLVTHDLDEAEALCGLVLAMRDGRVLDSGSPAELVDRYGKSATITFTLTDDLPIHSLTELPGVDRVQVRTGRVTITGSRVAIAHVGAALAHRGAVPGDLSVRVPTLDDALVGLLSGAVIGRCSDTERSGNGQDDKGLIGATR